MSLGPKRHQDPLAGVRLMTVSKRRPATALAAGAAQATDTSRQTSQNTTRLVSREGSRTSSNPRPRSVSRESGLSKSSTAVTKRTMASSKGEVLEGVREKMSRPPDIAPIRGGNINVHQVTPSFVSEFWNKMKKDSEEFKRIRSAQPSTANQSTESDAQRRRKMIPAVRSASSMQPSRGAKPSPSPMPRPVTAKKPAAAEIPVTSSAKQPQTTKVSRSSAALNSAAPSSARASRQASCDAARRQHTSQEQKRPMISARAAPAASIARPATTPKTSTPSAPSIIRKAVIAGNGATRRAPTPGPNVTKGTPRVASQKSTAPLKSSLRTTATASVQQPHTSGKATVQVHHAPSENSNHNEGEREHPEPANTASQA